MNATANGRGRAAIFGASGGIGGALVEALMERGYEVLAGSRRGVDHAGEGFKFDLTDEASIARAALMIGKGGPLDLVIVATGALILPDGRGPEKSFRALDASMMAQILAINTIGPALIGKHLLPLLPRGERSVFAALSARVGSIGDNRLGGWHSYRASKAALNMVLRNFAIELRRTHKQAIVAALHPGTVNSALSEPFQSAVPQNKLFTPEFAAQSLLGVINGLTPADSGKAFAWDGTEIPA